MEMGRTSSGRGRQVVQGWDGGRDAAEAPEVGRKGSEADLGVVPTVEGRGVSEGWAEVGGDLRGGWRD